MNRVIASGVDSTDIGRAAAFLATDSADYTTGKSLLVDGGLALRAALP